MELARDAGALVGHSGSSAFPAFELELDVLLGQLTRQALLAAYQTPGEDRPRDRDQRNEDEAADVGRRRFREVRRDEDRRERDSGLKQSPRCLDVDADRV